VTTANGGLPVCELHRDPTTARVPDTRRALVTERDQQIAQPSREGSERFAP
jgi:hypothetical protein